jgi:hypothetical protein
MPKNSVKKKPNRTSAHTRQPRSWWFEHYHACQSSGLSQSDYCRQHGINRSSFANWTRRFEQAPQEQQSRSESRPTFFAVTPSSIKPPPNGAGAFYHRQ